MRIRLRTALDVDGGTRALLERRLRFALSRFEPRIIGVELRVRDVNGPRGGLDHQCRLAVRLSWPRKSVVVEVQDVDIESAVGRCAERAARSVARALDTSREVRRAGLRRQDVA